ncbi:hypothetical protein [uncultured Campylobacter sp.]|uniref:hypothetical protein n=1 Tax=uncultured Campylobacter sp. TaxID=218934 RepID=UPI002615FB8F|nr:hypothetical protein [uncultured Campylobacter sp.]
MIKTDRILKFNAVFAAYEICNVNLKAAPRFMKFHLNFSLRYVRIEAGKTSQSQDRAYCKDNGGTLLRSLTKPVSPPMTL